MIENLNYIQHERPQNFGIEEFLKKTFIQFGNELNLLRKTIYNYENPEFVFELNERAWIGVLNNAIIKAFPNSAVTLQEFVVRSPDKFVGRADFLVHWKDSNDKEFYLMFEAKQYNEKSSLYLHDDAGDYLDTIMRQGQKYIEAEYDYYKDKTIYVIPIVFAWWIRNFEISNKAKDFFLPEKLNHDKSTDFCSLYFEDDSGMWVYGKIYRSSIK